MSDEARREEIVRAMAEALGKRFGPTWGGNVPVANEALDAVLPILARHREADSERLRAENKRLREALMLIADVGPRGSAVLCRHTAAKALAADPSSAQRETGD